MDHGIRDARSVSNGVDDHSFQGVDPALAYHPEPEHQQDAEQRGGLSGANELGPMEDFSRDQTLSKRLSRIREERSTGAEIRSHMDIRGMLNSLARGNTPIKIGTELREHNRRVEYWPVAEIIRVESMEM
jgi:hypothetical protein